MFRKKQQEVGPRFAADWLVFGLGNPGEEHARNRHNVGFWTVNELAKRAGTQPKSTGSLMAIGVGTLQGQRVALVKPKTYYNLAGKAFAQALQWTGCPLDHVIVVYDEIDLNEGALRVRSGGGHGGNNGLKSIMGHAGAEFIRVRIGIGRPVVGGEPSWEPEVVAAWVLGNPSGEAKTRLEETVRAAADAVECIIVDGPDVAGSRYNRR